MLSEDEKIRLKEEEFYRYEIRKLLEIQPRKSAANRIWNLANSSFGIWLMSSVVASLVVFLYSEQTRLSAIKTERSEKLNKIKTEAVYRMDKLKLGIFNFTLKMAPGGVNNFQIKGQNKIDATNNAKGFLLGLDSLFNSADCNYEVRKQNWNIFPELSNRSLDGLLFELEWNDVDSVSKSIDRGILTQWTRQKFELTKYLNFYIGNPDIFIYDKNAKK